MNKLFLILVLLLTSCFPPSRFRVGDCVCANDGKESWEMATYHYKIIAVGKTHYHVAHYLDHVYYTYPNDLSTSRMLYLDDHGELEKCLPEVTK